MTYTSQTLSKVSWSKLNTENEAEIIRLNKSDDFLNTVPRLINGSVYQDFRKTLGQVHHTSTDTTAMNGLEMALLCGLVTAWKYTPRSWKLMAVNMVWGHQKPVFHSSCCCFDILSFTLIRKFADYFCSKWCSKYGFRFTSISNMSILPCLEKEMATHSSILGWEIPWTEEPGRLQSMGLQKSWTQLSNWTTITLLN